MGSDENIIDYNLESVLVVDDEEIVSGPLVEMLLVMGFNAGSANSGKAALKFLHDKDFTFLLTDIVMPGMNGLDLIKRVKKQNSDILCIAMTGYSRDYKYVDVVDAGASDFINKPFGIEELEAKIRRAIIERDAREELSRLSITDALTGLFNQRHFYTQLKGEITRADRQNQNLSLILLDLDDFKKYNDTYGHLAGDALLQKVGSIISACIRDGVDSGYRYGGDEFAVILIDADKEIGRRIGRRIQESIRSECSIGASMGFAYFSEGMTAEEFVGTADKHLYKFKGKKKNNTDQPETNVS